MTFTIVKKFNNNRLKPKDMKNIKLSILTYCLANTQLIIADLRDAKEKNRQHPILIPDIVFVQEEGFSKN